MEGSLLLREVRNVNLCRLQPRIVLSLLGLILPKSAEAVQFERGDVFASLSNGNIAHYTPTGVLKSVYNVAGGETPPAGGEIAAGMAFDPAGNLYVTRYSAFRLAKLDNSGKPLSSNLVSGLNAPQSVAIDRAGDIYVGNLYAGLRKYKASGALLGTITPNRIEFFDLSLDESTIFYGNGSDVRRVFNSIPGTPGADFSSELHPRVFGMRVRTNGEWLLANQADIKRLSPTGSVMASYDAPGEDIWFALNLDPDGGTFWAASYSGSLIYRFDIATGRIVTTIRTGDTKVGGLAIASVAPPASGLAPSISSAEVRNAASFEAGISPGALVTIFGANLGARAGEVLFASTAPWPRQIAGTTVWIDGSVVPMYRVLNLSGQEQVTVLAPYSLAGKTSVPVSIITLAGASTTVTVPVKEIQPGIFIIDEAGNGAARHGVDVVSPSNPAEHGELVVIYLTGLGPVDNPPPSGEPASLSTLARTLFTPRLLVGAREADVAFSGLTPGSIGLYQINFTVPVEAASGIAEIAIEANGVRSNIARLAIR
jgi:uncharacterized protein (TIGR03437 family)